MAKLTVISALCGSALLLAGCMKYDSPANTDSAAAAQGSTAADTEAIQAANARWLDLIRSKDSAAIGRMYLPDGALMAPNAPIATGPQAIAGAWQAMLQTPGFSLTFATQSLVVSKSGDMALDRGTYEVAMNSPDGPVAEVGKYVVVWRKSGGEWKVAADIFNSDKPHG